MRTTKTCQVSHSSYLGVRVSISVHLTTCLIFVPSLLVLVSSHSIYPIQSLLHSSHSIVYQPNANYTFSTCYSIKHRSVISLSSCTHSRTCWIHLYFVDCRKCWIHALTWAMIQLVTSFILLKMLEYMLQ